MKIIKKYKYLISIILLIIIIVLVFYKKNTLKESNIVLEDNVLNPEIVKVIKKQLIKVDIKGYVKTPGVYELESGSRVIDLINISGGLLENANTSLINLSKELTDEMVIIIYSNEEVANSNVKEIETVYKIIEKECNCPNIKNDSCINTELDDNSNEELININTASKEDLLKINGIGESKADSIIKYRITNGNFSTLEDIMNVSGIGEGIYNQIKEFITI